MGTEPQPSPFALVVTPTASASFEVRLENHSLQPQRYLLKAIRQGPRLILKDARGVALHGDDLAAEEEHPFEEYRIDLSDYRMLTPGDALALEPIKFRKKEHGRFSLEWASVRFEGLPQGRYTVQVIWECLNNQVEWPPNSAPVVLWKGTILSPVMTVNLLPRAKGAGLKRP